MPSTPWPHRLRRALTTPAAGVLHDRGPKTCMDWYQANTAMAAAQLGVDIAHGLPADEAHRRRQHYGPNELIERAGRPPAAILRDQLTGTMVLVLIAAAVVSAAIGDLHDALAIAAIVLLNAILGFTQEFRAERAMRALKQLAVPRVRVRRDGLVREIAASDLVPGDVVLLEAGNVVAADARIVEAANLRVQEAALTGESGAVGKQSDRVVGEGLPIGDRRNMAFMGTSVVQGRGMAIVTGTGMETELGTIAATLQDVRREQTPLQRRLDALGRALALAALAIVSVVFVLGLARGEPLRLMFLTAVSMAVAAVPEGLPAVVTIALALGAQRMLRRRALIRKLSAVETLGAVTVICSDKTGTLTENRMGVSVIEVPGRRVALDAARAAHEHVPEDLAITLLLTGAALCNDAALQGDAAHLRAVGDPTEAALVDAAATFGLRKDDLDRRFPRVGEVPFESERKRMTTVHTLPGAWLPLEQAIHGAWALGNDGEPSHVAFTKGAVDRLVELCTAVWDGGQLRPLDENGRREIMRIHDRLAADGMRVLGVAFRALGPAPDIAAVEADLVYAGLLGLIDPPRSEVRQSIATCTAAGIRAVMITGDHPLTARHVAARLGLRVGDRVITGADLAAMSPQDLDAVVGTASVFARVSPQHKLRIVEALQRRGDVVAMTGDGVNDAPALRRADIGVAMGITGTDVSKEAADAVLLDDNFATIVSAVEEGRIIYDNIRKFVKYLLATNSSELWLMLVAPLAGMPLPLLPLQILWINLVTDGPTALLLGVEPAERGVMQRPPRPPGQSIFAGGLGQHVIWVGMLMAALTCGTGYWYWRAGAAQWQTMVFTTLALSQMAHVLAIRSSTESLVRTGVFTNPLLAGAVAVTVALQMALIYIPALQQIFSTTPLSAIDLLWCGAVAGTIFVAVEAEKWLLRRPAAVTRRPA
jgi:Ca2+-transporting ATPase